MTPEHIPPEKIKDALLLQDIMDVKVRINDGMLVGIVLDLSGGREVVIHPYPKKKKSELIMWDITPEDHDDDD